MTDIIAVDLIIFFGLSAHAFSSHFAVQTNQKTPQSISFPQLQRVTYGDGPISVNATATSGLPVSYKITCGTSQISGNTLLINDTGPVCIVAMQNGDTIFAPAASVQQTLIVQKKFLEIVPNSAQRMYLAPDPLFTGTVIGAIDSDHLSIEYTSGGTRLTSPGTYSDPMIGIVGQLAVSPTSHKYVTMSKVGSLVICPTSLSGVGATTPTSCAPVQPDPIPVPTPEPLPLPTPKPNPLPHPIAPPEPIPAPVPVPDPPPSPAPPNDPPSMPVPMPVPLPLPSPEPVASPVSSTAVPATIGKAILPLPLPMPISHKRSGKESTLNPDASLTMLMDGSAPHIIGSVPVIIIMQCQTQDSSSQKVLISADNTAIKELSVTPGKEFRARLSLVTSDTVSLMARHFPSKDCPAMAANPIEVKPSPQIPFINSAPMELSNPQPTTDELETVPLVQFPKNVFLEMQP